MGEENMSSLLYPLPTATSEIAGTAHGKGSKAYYLGCTLELLLLPPWYAIGCQV